ncbi:MAG: hypothetical protein HKN68_07840 [Saprospiraceae bacterium]|nr:hypothetical protein [Saprospiraceae bacterium]
MLFKICCCLLLLSSCSGRASNSSTETETKSTLIQEEYQATPDSTLLCQINGVDWYYTTVRARKIMSTDYNPRKKFALNFKNENSPANENISLMYNAVTKQLEYVDIALQDPGAEAGRRIFSGISGYTEEETSQIKDIGVLTNISGNKISGNAAFKIPKNSKGIFKNEMDQDIVVSDLTFKGIQYEDESEY